jgi:hypothetical protein
MSEISHLPLDLFDDPDADTPPVVQHDAWCQWCGAARPASDITCSACGARLVAIPAARLSPEGEPRELLVFERCPWCHTDVSEDDDSCPSCFANLRVDPNHNIPGVNVPLTDKQLRDLSAAYQRLDGDSDPTGPLIDVLLVAARLLLGVRF